MKLGRDEILCINALSAISGVDARDCIIGSSVISYLVKEQDVGRAVGRNASNIKRLREKIKKQIEIFEYCGTVEKFLKKALYNIKFNDVIVNEQDGKKRVIILLDSENKRKLLNMSSRFKRTKELAKRDYNVYEIRVK